MATPSVQTQELIDGRYRLERKLGSGGMAAVWLADDDRLDRKVAIKRLHTSAPSDAAGRLAREARLGAGLSDPHLVTVYDAIATEDGVLIVMELVEGTDLSRELGSGPLEDERALHVLDCIAQALDHAHERGVVHRDVKPSNVLLGSGDVVKVTDLGIAKALEETGVTQSGVILGSVPYMSPEQLLGEPVGPQSDIYSLALIAYECLTGTRARTETGAAAAAHRVMNDSPPDISLERPGTSPALASVLSRALDRDPSRRPGSAVAFVRDLADALRSEAPAPVAPAPEPTQPTRVDRSRSAAGVESLEEPLSPVTAYGRRGDRRRRIAALFAIAALIALIAVVAVTQLGGGSGDSRSGDGSSSAGKSASAARGGDSAGGGDANGTDAASAGAAASDAPASQAGGTAVASGSAGAADDPAKAVEDFYTLAAAQDTREAWRLAAPSFRTQLEGYSTFAAQQSTLRSIEFRSLETTSQTADSANVSFEDTATHTDHVDRCQGTAALTSDGGAWRIAQLTSVDCTPG